MNECNQATDMKSIPKHVRSKTVVITLGGSPGAGKSTMIEQVIVPALRENNLDFVQNDENVLSVNLSLDDINALRGTVWRPTPGDLVQLKSGGVTMTVVDLYGCDQSDVEVIFDLSGKLHREEVPLACLRSAREEMF